MNAWGKRLAIAFTCDLRSLAVFRAALGIILLADLAWRLPLFEALYSNEGAWPSAAAMAETPSWHTVSLHTLGNSNAWAYTLFGIAAIAAVTLTIGWWTRISTITSWALLVSLQQRNTLVLNGGDVLLHLLLFWGIFLPLGARWSLDARARRPPADPYFSAATVALLTQIAIVYVFNALYKNSSTWRVSGEAIHEALLLETYTTRTGEWLLQFPGLLQAGTHAVWYLELIGPFIAFIPWRNNLMRAITAAAFISFHASLLLTLRIGLFPIIGIIAWLPFLPGTLWDKLTPSRHEESRAPLRLSPSVQILASAFLAYVVVWNVLGFFHVPMQIFRFPGDLLQLQQKWALFAPAPARTEGRMVAVIETSDGDGYDAFTGQIVDWRRPQHLGRILPSAQWRKYLAANRDSRHPDRARLLAAWLRRDWEKHHPEHTVVRVRLHYLWEWAAHRQSPPDNWLIYENPPGPISEMARAAGSTPIPPSDQTDQ